jgi:hypothetical protein
MRRRPCDEGHNAEGHNDEGHNDEGHNDEGHNDEGHNDEGNDDGHTAGDDGDPRVEMPWWRRAMIQRVYRHNDTMDEAAYDGPDDTMDTAAYYGHDDWSSVYWDSHGWWIWCEYDNRVGWWSHQLEEWWTDEW